MNRAAGGVLAATLIGALLRLWALDARPIHHDEAVNWFLFYGVRGQGYYDYDPSNFHGPLHFLVGALVQGWFGDGLTTLRLPTALLGAALPPLVWLLRRQLGPAGTVAAAWLLATSPTLVYYARDAIHETWLVAFTLTGLTALVRGWSAETSTEARRAALLLGASFGGALATKETVAILAAAAAPALLLAAALRRPSPGFTRQLPAALAAATLTTALLYTSFFQHPSDLLDLARTLQVWGARGLDGDGHDKPATYFLGLLTRYEAAAVALSCLGAARSVHRRDPFGLALTLTAAAQLAIYSAIPYKTPWLVLNLTLPLTVLAGLGARALSEGRLAVQLLGAVTLAPLAVLSLQHTARVCFVDHDRQAEPLVYVQTQRELVELMRLAQRLPTPARLRSFYPERYPMNWYLWHHGLSEEPLDPLPDEADGDLVLLDPHDASTLIPRMHGPYLRRDVPFRNGLLIAALLAERHAHLLTDRDNWDLLAPADAPPASP